MRCDSRRYSRTRRGYKPPFRLRTWRSGPEKNQPKPPPAVRSMIERGLVELRSGQRGVRGFFTEVGIAAMRQLVADRRLMNPTTFAHLRVELGLDESGQERSVDDATGASEERS